MRLRLRLAAATAVVVGAMLAPGVAWAACPTGWTRVQSPSPLSTNPLASVAASGRHTVWAVGRKGFERSLAMRWNGERWRIVDLPNPEDEDELNVVTHVPRSHRFIAGGRHGGATIPTQTFTLQGAHGEWSYSARAERLGNLYGADARNPSEAWLVGHRPIHGVGPHPMALHRTGDRWRRVDVPQATSIGHLTDVAVVPGTHQAWAVGARYGTEPYTFRWRNGTWSDVENTFSNVELDAVETLGPKDVWVAGRRLVGEIDEETFLAHWDGSSWEVSPTGTGHPGELLGLAAVDRDDIWAVGDIWAADSDFLHYDGFTWEEVPTSIPGDGVLHDITTVPGSRRLWAVGERSSGKTLTMRYCG